MVNPAAYGYTAELHNKEHMNNPFPPRAPFPAAPAMPVTWDRPAAPVIPASAIPLNPAIDGKTGEYVTGKDGAILTRDDLLADWEASKLALEAAKETERKLRDQVVAVFSDADKDKGTEHVALANDWKLTVVKNLDYKLCSKNPEQVSHEAAIQAALKRIREYVSDTVPIGVGAILAMRLVRTEYTLSVGEYGKLPEELKAIIDEVIVTSDVAPKVVIVPPKETKL